MPRKPVARIRIPNTRMLLNNQSQRISEGSPKAPSDGGWKP